MKPPSLFLHVSLFFGGDGSNSRSSTVASFANGILWRTTPCWLHRRSFTVDGRCKYGFAGTARDPSKFLGRGRALLGDWPEERRTWGMPS